MGAATTSPAGAAGDNPKQHAPIVFVAYPFRSRDGWIRQYVSSILDRWGYAAKEGSRFEGRSISRAVCSAIAEAQRMVAFITKCKKLEKKGWATSDWVLEEVGYATGKGIPVVAIVEKGVDVNLGILSDIKTIDLDPNAPYHALIRLRLALQDILPNASGTNDIRIAHIARPKKKTARRQWWDFWSWVDAPSQVLDTIDNVSYRFPPSFRPAVEVGENRDYAFGNYGETDQAFVLKVVINCRNGPSQKLSHRISLP